MEAVTTHGERAEARRPWPLLGIAFPVLFFIGFVITGTPDDDASDGEWTSYFNDGGHQAGLVISAFLLVIGALCMLAFFVSLWQRLGDAARPATRISPLPVCAAIVGATCVALGAVINAVVAGELAFGSGPEPSPDILRFADSIGFPMIVVAGMIAIALAIATISLQAREAGFFTPGFATFSLVMAAITFFSFLFFPLLAMLLWFVVAGVRLYRGSLGAREARGIRGAGPTD